MSNYQFSHKPQLELHTSPADFMNELDEHLETKEKEGEQIAYSFLSWKQIDQIDYPKEQWIVDRIIPEKGLTCIAGLPATMKSYFSNYIAGCIAEGKPVLDMYSTKQTNVLFIDKENKLSRIQDRFRRLGIPSSEHIYFLESNFLVEETSDLAAVCAFIRDHGIQLTFIDTLIRVHQTDENSASEMNKIFHALHELQLAGSAVCFIHHFNKRGSGFGQTTDVRELLRGSGDILAMVDNYLALKLTSNSPFIEVEQAKSRDDELIPKFLMEVVFSKETTTFNFLREINEEDKIRKVVVEDEILSLLEKGTATRKFIIDKLEGFASKRTIDDAIKILKKTEDIVSYTNGKEAMYCLKKNTLLKGENVL